MSTILIFAEQRGGALHPAVGQLIRAARQFDGSADIRACVLGTQLSGPAATLATWGVAGVLTVEDPRLERYTPQPYVRALQAAATHTGAQIVLLPASFMGRDLAPRLAVRLHAALATDCVALRGDGGNTVVTRPVYMGKATAELRLDPKIVNVVSIRPNAFAAVEPVDGAAAAVAPLAVHFTDDDSRLSNREWVRAGSGIKDVTEADIVVSGGRSLKSEENFKILFELAEVLDAAVGASRAACDAGYQPHTRQVGLTGKTVTPKLYLAFGIDGAIQHLAGMRGSKVIAAINTKKEAPIFNVATYGCVADLFVMAPLLTEAFKKVLR